MPPLRGVSDAVPSLRDFASANGNLSKSQTLRRYSALLQQTACGRSAAAVEAGRKLKALQNGCFLFEINRLWPPSIRRDTQEQQVIYTTAPACKAPSIQSNLYTVRTITNHELRMVDPLDPLPTLVNESVSAATPPLPPTVSSHGLQPLKPIPANNPIANSTMSAVTLTASLQTAPIPKLHRSRRLAILDSAITSNGDLLHQTYEGCIARWGESWEVKVRDSIGLFSRWDMRAFANFFITVIKKDARYANSIFNSNRPDTERLLYAIKDIGILRSHFDVAWQDIPDSDFEISLIHTARFYELLRVPNTDIVQALDEVRLRLAETPSTLLRFDINMRITAFCEIFDMIRSATGNFTNDVDARTLSIITQRELSNKLLSEHEYLAAILNNYLASDRSETAKKLAFALATTITSQNPYRIEASSNSVELLRV